MKYSLIFLLMITSILTLLSPSVFALDTGDLEPRIRSFIGDDVAIIVMGKYVTPMELQLFNYLRDQYPDIADKEVINDSQYTGYTPAIIIGGTMQNSVQIPEPYAKNVTDLALARIEFLETEKGKYIIIKSKLSDTNYPRTNLKNSPLAKYMPEQYVPVGAAAVSVAMLSIWNFIFMHGRKIIKSIVSDRIMKFVKKKEFRPNFKGIMIKGVKIRYREWNAILLSALIFALSVTYSFLTDLNALELVMINLIVNSIIYASGNIIRLIYDKKYKHDTEYVFWYWGGLATLVSGWLGSTFSLAGYTVSEKESENENRISFNINLVTYLIGIGFFIWNLLTPSKILQMSMLLAISGAFFHMLPMKPFKGYNLIRWSPWRWTIFFIPLFLTYVLVSIL
jgi:hypothetical protein